MKTLLILALLDNIDDLCTVTCNVLAITLTALKKKDIKILLVHIQQNILLYFFTLLLPLVQASLYMLGMEDFAILIILTILTILKKMVQLDM